jgi:drug/metabolite transporter (DMT)-like permease
MKKAFLQLHIAVLLAGFTAVMGKLIVLNEGFLVWYRLLISVLIIGLVLRLKRQLIKISFSEFKRISFVGFILAFHWVTFYGSVKYANASVAVICISAAGFFSAIIEPLIFKTKFIWAELGLGLLALIGIYIIFDFHPHFKLGVFLGIISALGSAAFPMFNKKLLNEFSPKVLTFYEFLGALIGLSCCLPFYLFSHHITVIPSASDWMWLLILSVFCTVTAFDLQLNALKKISYFTYNLTYNLEPLYGIVLAFVFFKENRDLQPQFYLGLFLILLAVGLQMTRVIKVKK